MIFVKEGIWFIQLINENERHISPRISLHLRGLGLFLQPPTFWIPAFVIAGFFFFFFFFNSLAPSWLRSSVKNTYSSTSYSSHSSYIVNLTTRGLPYPHLSHKTYPGTFFQSHTKCIHCHMPRTNSFSSIGLADGGLVFGFFFNKGS